MAILYSKRLASKVPGGAATALTRIGVVGAAAGFMYFLLKKLYTVDGKKRLADWKAAEKAALAAKLEAVDEMVKQYGVKRANDLPISVSIALDKQLADRITAIRKYYNGGNLERLAGAASK